MQPTLCSKCKKNVAVVFISRQNEKGEMVNEGLCLKCAAQLGTRRGPYSSSSRGPRRARRAACRARRRRRGFQTPF